MHMATKRGLGKGLDALFGVYKEDDEKEITAKPSKTISAGGIKANAAPPAAGKGVSAYMNDEKMGNAASQSKVLPKGVVVNEFGVAEIDMKLIDPNKGQPRKSFNSASLKELSESIKLHGVIQPIVVNEKNGRYMIIAGERRFRAALIAGLKTVPAIIKHYNDREIKEVSLIENLQREDLNPIEAARAIKELMDGYNFTQETVADRIGKSRPAIANTLRLLTLCPEVVAMIENNKLSAGHARALVVVTNKEAQIDLANRAADNKMTVRDLEKAVREYTIPAAKHTKTAAPQSLELRALIEDMKRAFATKVTALGNDRRGRIYIDYFSRDDLDRIAKIVELIKANPDKINK